MHPASETVASLVPLWKKGPGLYEYALSFIDVCTRESLCLWLCIRSLDVLWTLFSSSSAATSLHLFAFAGEYTKYRFVTEAARRARQNAALIMAANPMLQLGAGALVAPFAPRSMTAPATLPDNSAFGNADQLQTSAGAGYLLVSATGPIEDAGDSSDEDADRFESIGRMTSTTGLLGESVM